MNRIRFVLLFAAFAALITCLPLRAQSSYHQVHEYKPGGDGGWDYLTMDPDSRRLYISRGNHFQVLNIDSGNLEGDVTGLQGVHGIALDKADNKGFISDGRDNSVVVIDLKSLKTTGKVQAGTNPDAILFDPSTKRVFAFNGRSSNATAIDAKDNKVAGTVALDGKPEFAVSDGKGKVFVNIEDKSEVQQIDPKTLKVVNTWPLAPCESPSGLALDASDGRLFAGCDNETMAILDANSGKVVATEKVGKGVDAAAYDKAVHQAYTSNGQDGTITVVKENGPSDFAVAESVPTKRSARTMTVDDKTHNLITVAADFEKAPEQAAGQPRQRPKMVPGSFVVLVYGK
jgi:YVTN family beta-propeller protein